MSMENARTFEREFRYMFQITRMVLFEVSYYTLGDNARPYFATSAHKFNQPKTDYTTGGQCQKEVLPEDSEAMAFFRKWDHMHLLELDRDAYDELVGDVEALKDVYNYFSAGRQKSGQVAKISFYKAVELSKQPLRKKTKKNHENDGGER